MKEIIKKYIFLIIITLLFISPIKAYASSSEYVINNYDINIVVNENNTLKITEKIGAYFNVEKHGIFRKIPLRNTVTRLDGTTSKNRAQISEIEVSDNYSVYSENGYKVIKIGDVNYTITGQKNYTISYLYNLGKDTGKEYDELYFNLIGNEWDTSISNITFTITMPKEFDKSKLGFSSGAVGSTNSSKITYNINGNVITGKLNGTINPGDALTVRLELPEGYFVGASNNIDLMMIISIVLPILFVIIAYFIWRIYGKDEHVIEIVEFYPPEGFNSLEVGFLYKGKAENQDVISLLIYLANKGYLEINNKKIDLNSEKVSLNQDSKNNANQKIIELQTKINEERINNPSSKKIKYYENMIDIYKNIDTPINYEQYGLKSSINKLNKENKFLIKKLKEYDGNNINEKWFMDGLFEYDRTEVTDKMLYNNFYITMDKILSNINNKENKHKILEKSASNKKIFIILMIIATYCLITIPPSGGINPFALIFPGIGFTIMFEYLFGETKTIYVNDKPTRSVIANKSFGLLFGMIFGGIPWVSWVLPALLEDYIYLIIYIVGLLCVVCLVICLRYLPKRTPYGNQILGKIKGFKNFLETVEKDKLEAMVMENPTYFYDILPYTYVLGVSDKWIKKFETISLHAPSWYDSPTGFNVTSFGTFMNNTMSSAEQSMSSSPSSSSGGSSGGGSSGGGSGGGGGGSW